MTEKLIVTQEDREAVAAYWKVSHIGNSETQRRYLSGEADGSFIVQAFARHRLAATASRWQPIESAPHDESRILICMDVRFGQQDVCEGRWNVEQGCFTSTNGFLIFDSATHWQLLPTPPASEPITEELIECVERAIRDVNGGINYDYMDFCRDAARAALTAAAPALMEQGARLMQEAAAKFCDAEGAYEQEGYGLNRAAQNYYRARNGIRALSPADIVKGVSSHD